MKYQLKSERWCGKVWPSFGNFLLLQIEQLSLLRVVTVMPLCSTFNPSTEMLQPRGDNCNMVVMVTCDVVLIVLITMVKKKMMQMTMMLMLLLLLFMRVKKLGFLSTMHQAELHIS